MIFLLRFRKSVPQGWKPPADEPASGAGLRCGLRALAGSPACAPPNRGLGGSRPREAACARQAGPASVPTLGGGKGRGACASGGKPVRTAAMLGVPDPASRLAEAGTGWSVCENEA